MTKKFDEELIEEGILKFDTKPHFLSTTKSICLFSCPFPGIKLLKIDKDTVFEVTIKKKE